MGSSGHHSTYYPLEVSSMKYCCLGVFRKEYFRLLIFRKEYFRLLIFRKEYFRLLILCVIYIYTHWIYKENQYY